MAINGTHMLFYTSEAEKLRAMLRDVFGFKHVDAGGGWLIFRLPPAEIGVHPAEGPNYDSGMRHEISFMCDDIHKTVAELRAKGVSMDSNIKTERYGHTTMLHLPGGCRAMLYQPLHAIAAEIPKAGAAKKAVRRRQKAAVRPPRKAAKARRGRRAKKAPRRR
jgi:catechol 2,3-dioxygenase-like lactoylglutathione lyase family enzyme